MHLYVLHVFWYISLGSNFNIIVVFLKRRGPSLFPTVLRIVKIMCVSTAQVFMVPLKRMIGKISKERARGHQMFVERALACGWGF